MAEDAIGKWSKGEHYGPVLSQTDLYLLGVPLEVHPIFRGTHPSFHLNFDLTNGDIGGYDASDRHRTVPFSQRDEPATLPRVSQLIIITHSSPWCTIVTNDNGVTLGDICIKLWADYSQNNITDAELGSLPPRAQEGVRRSAQHHASAPSWGGYYQQPAPQVNQFKRYDWLRERSMFDELVKSPSEDNYIKQRLGFTAPNIFVLNLVQ